MDCQYINVYIADCWMKQINCESHYMYLFFLLMACAVMAFGISSDHIWGTVYTPSIQIDKTEQTG